MTESPDSVSKTFSLEKKSRKFYFRSSFRSDFFRFFQTESVTKLSVVSEQPSMYGVLTVVELKAKLMN